MMKKKIIISVLILLAIVTGVSSLAVALRMNSEKSVEYNYESDLASVQGFSRVLRVAGGTDFSPFCYIDEDGKPCGHDIEIAFALGRELGCRIEVTLGDWTEMQQGLLDGTYDILLTADYSEERSRIMGYTSPVCLDSYVFFGADKSINSDDMQTLKSLRIAALDGGGATDNYLVPMGLTGNTTFYATQADAFRSVERGENDVAIAGYIYGSNIIGSMKMKLVQVGSPLYGVAYYFTYSINNASLGPELNAALAAMEARGELESITEKWTTHYQPSLTLAQFIRQNLQSVLIVALIGLIAVIILTSSIIQSISRREKSMLERDNLTGLYNTRTFLNRFGILLQKNRGKSYVLIRFDIDNFRGFNQTQGVAAGDRMLTEIGRKLQSDTESKYGIVLAGYLGADHFVLISEDAAVTDNPEQLYNDLSVAVRSACPGYSITIKMGLCRTGDDISNPSDYCDRALLALRSSKNNFYKRWAWFDESIRKALDDEKAIADRMFTALDEGRFIPFFQPQYDYSTKEIIGAEALVRWIEADGNIIPPDRFVPVFEKNGFIYEMDKAVWRRVCESIRKWKDDGIMPPHISVNISRADIYHSDLVDTLLKTMSDYGVTVDDLHFEITESAYIESGSLLVETINRLKTIGAFVEIDDFGNGYSSLASLKTVNADLIKLDMSFLRNNTLRGKDAALLSSMVQIGKDLGMSVIAEGVEKTEQAEYLHSIGCDMMQGYLFSKPVNTEAFEKMLKKA